MKPLIIANWKMNPQTLKEAKELFGLVKRGTKNIKNIEVVICPPFIYIPELKIKNSNIKIGAQDCFWEEKGAFTGEISPSMLKNLSCEYIIIGHSERRRYFQETDEIINKKIKKVLSFSLKPILCIGETEAERAEGKKEEVLLRQIKGGLKDVSRKEAKYITIAYEPVRAIGTGNNCSVNETMSSIISIRKVIFQLYNRETADSLRVLYGGSVTGENTADYIKEAGANGLLVGGTSLKAEEFIKIIKSI